jgi:hypothetical protein
MQPAALAPHLLQPDDEARIRREHTSKSCYTLFTGVETIFLKLLVALYGEDLLINIYSIKYSNQDHVATRKMSWISFFWTLPLNASGKIIYTNTNPSRGLLKCKAWGYTGWAARARNEVRNVRWDDPMVLGSPCPS